jgi:hypothetical protein
MMTFALPGTITADATWFVKAPCDLTLRSVSACANNASTGQVNVGSGTDVDYYLDAKDLGDSDTPTVYDLDDFNGTGVANQGDDYPHYTAGDIIIVNLDVDGSTDPVDPCIVLFFEEG